jgi:hypothetical protein
VDAVTERERSLAVQLAGNSAAIRQERAHTGLTEAREDLASSDVGIGLGLMKVWDLGEVGGSDYAQYAFAATNGESQGNLYVRVSGSELARLGADREDDVAWVRQRLNSIIAAVAADDRWAALLARHKTLL